jgi:IS30 family transposase
MNYHHLTVDERTRFDCLLQAGQSISQIAHLLQRSASTLYRERRRNGKGRASPRMYYQARFAQAQAEARASGANAHPRIAARVYRQARRYLTRLDMSPAQIARRLAISAEWLYQWIYRQIAKGFAWHRHLRSGRPARHNRRQRLQRAQATACRALPIAQRTDAANARTEFGHWEADLLLGRKDCAGAVLVVKERKSRLTLLRRLYRRNSDTVMRALAKLLRPYRQHLRSLTTDNGTEFFRHARFADLTGCALYLCEPHSPWQRGQVEGENKNIRQYLPKSFNVDRLSPKRLRAVERKLNLRPKLVLNDRCPLEVANALSGVALRY